MLALPKGRPLRGVKEITSAWSAKELKGFKQDLWYLVLGTLFLFPHSQSCSVYSTCTNDGWFYTLGEVSNWFPHVIVFIHVDTEFCHECLLWFADDMRV